MLLCQLPFLATLWNCWTYMLLCLVHYFVNLVVFQPCCLAGISQFGCAACYDSVLTFTCALAGQLQQWLQSAFLPAMEYIQTLTQAVQTPFVTSVRNALSHLTGIGTRCEFACGLFHGLGANLDEVGRQGLAQEISRLTGEPNVLSIAAMADASALLRYLTFSEYLTHLLE